MLKRFFKETLIYGLSTYIQKFIGVFLLPLYTALLTPEDYGILDLLGTVAIISIYLVVSGTDSSLSYYYFRKEHLKERPVMVSSTLFIRITFAAAAFILVGALSHKLTFLIFGKDYSLFLILTGISLAVQSIYSFFTDLIRFEKRPWIFTWVSVSNLLINIGLNIYFILILKKGVWGAIMASVICYGIMAAFTIYYVFSRYGIHFSFSWAKKILAYGSPLIGTAFAVWILTTTDRYFLAHYRNIADIGIYAVGFKLASFLGLVSGALQMAWSPYAMDIQYEPNAKKIYAKVFFIYFVVNILAVFFISMFSIDLLKVFTQPAYYSAKAVVPFLCMSVVFFSGYFIVSIGIAVTKKAQHTIWITLTAAAVNIAMNFLLTPAIGAVGAALSIMSANFLIFVLTLSVSQKLYPVNYGYITVAALFLPAAAIVAVSYYYDLALVYRIPLAVLYFAAASVYLYFNLKNSDEMKMLIGKVKSMGSKGRSADTKPGE
ncbi:MAG TPA: polysaccharide biosynthesis C-terminal domain-containing protein [Ignavibacteria bacterium]|nr:polysaccharide biosynthesis C-terminal domain-containing protein [Ignavibacteria bacterium]HRF65121.1 polysaccharide biosynthesis C-terminal domain-containing protein [Ignavibacteria bacterium]HRJ05278.1 polysaccharide biosynthesis C-terminal domain-containing protein [Ignavibacteria bacterium]HRJ84996.1 polysaccharide biosynthesis C-terminal domain-containing protein [Ignavibacteria bacterium]